MLDSPYGELKFAPPNPYFIDLRQMEANLHQILIKISKNTKCRSKKIQGRHFLGKKSPCGTLHNIVKGLYSPNRQNSHLLPLTASRWEYLIYFLPLAASPYYKYHCIQVISAVHVIYVISLCVSILQTLCEVVERLAGFLLSENLTSLFSFDHVMICACSILCTS